MGLGVFVIRTTFIAPQGIADRPGEQFVIDLIWLCVTAEDRIEHVRIQAVPLGYHVIWFMLGDSESTGQAIAKSISRRVVQSTPLLAQWDVH